MLLECKTSEDTKLDLSRHEVLPGVCQGGVLDLA